MTSPRRHGTHIGSRKRLKAARQSGATVVCTTSPLPDRADRVALVVEGRIVAEASQRELLDTEPRCRAVVTWGEES